MGIRQQDRSIASRAVSPFRIGDAGICGKRGLFGSLGQVYFLINRQLPIIFHIHVGDIDHHLIRRWQS